MKRMFKTFSNMITALLFLIVIIMVFIVVSSKASGGKPNILGYQLKTVLSGSMEPTFKTGSIIAIKPIEELKRFTKSDVITFIQENQNVVTHRIIDVVNNGGNLMYQTKGDNNDDVDTQLVLSQNVVGKYTGFTIPYVGYLIEFAKSSKGTSILLFIPGILLLLYSGITILKALRDLDLPKWRVGETA